MNDKEAAYAIIFSFIPGLILAHIGLWIMATMYMCIWLTLSLFTLSNRIVGVSR